MTLGVDDYGIYNAVGGFVSMFWIVSSTLSGAVTRFFTYEMGKGPEGDVGRIFSVSLSLMLVLAGVTLLFAEPFGVWFLNAKMTIPAGREIASNWVFQTAIIAALLSVLATPFNSLIIAHERFGVYAFVNIGETLFLFFLALFMAHTRSGWDVLIIYAVGRLLISFLVNSFVVLYSFIHFRANCRKPGWDKFTLKELLSYSGWSLLSSFANVWGTQGVNVSLNIYAGPAVNAARGLAFTVTNSVGIFVNNFTAAIAPQVTKSLSAQEKEYFQLLVFKGSKLSFYIMLFMVVPLLMETEFVLALWLKEVPAFTVVFTRLALVAALIGMFENILSQAQKASGIIRQYQIARSILIVCTFLCSWYALRQGLSPVSVYIVGVVSAVLTVVITTVTTCRTFDFSPSQLIKGIYLPELSVWLCSSIAPYLIFRVMPSGWLRFLLMLVVSVISVAVCVYFIGFTKDEKKYFLQKLLLWIRRIKCFGFLK